MKSSIPTLYVRADASSTMGIGHIMRCLAIAQTWKANGGEVKFLTKPLALGIKQRLVSEGFQQILITDNASIIGEIEEIVKNIKDMRHSIILLDGYHFTAEYQLLIKNYSLKLIVVDDYSHATHYYADIILNRNLIADEALYSQKKEEYTQLLLGPKYNYVRNEFVEYGKCNYQVLDEVKDILVNIGGSDPRNLTALILQYMENILEHDVTVTIVLGSAYRHEKELSETLKRITYQVEVIRNTNNMADLMIATDLAITAGGTTLFELAYLGIPSIALKVADNQKSIDVFADKYRTTYALDAREQLSQSKFIEYLSLLMQKENRTEMRSRSKKLIDNYGNQRIVEAILKL